MSGRRTFHFLLTIGFAFSYSGIRASAQTASAVSAANLSVPLYGVSTVKVNNTGSGSTRLSVTDDLLRVTNLQLDVLLEAAYDIRRDQIEGLPHWAQAEHYDVVAKVVDMDAQQLRGLSSAQRRLMLQHLLAERFHIRAHVETRTLPLLKLTVDRGGVKFTEWQKSSERERQGPGSMDWNSDGLTAVGYP